MRVDRSGSMFRLGLLRCAMLNARKRQTRVVGQVTRGSEPDNTLLLPTINSCFWTAIVCEKR